MFAFTQTVQFLSEDGAALPQAPVTNQQVAEVLFNIATLLEMQQANPYRIQAYRNGARGMLMLAEPAIDIVRRGEELRFDGLGVRLRARSFVALDQANVLIPHSLMGRGEVDVVLTVGGQTANVVKVSIK